MARDRADGVKRAVVEAEAAEHEVFEEPGDVLDQDRRDDADEDGEEDVGEIERAGGGKRRFGRRLFRGAARQRKGRGGRRGRRLGSGGGIRGVALLGGHQGDGGVDLDLPEKERRRQHVRPDDEGANEPENHHAESAQLAHLRLGPVGGFRREFAPRLQRFTLVHPPSKHERGKHAESKREDCGPEKASGEEKRCRVEAHRGQKDQEGDGAADDEPPAEPPAEPPMPLEAAANRGRHVPMRPEQAPGGGEEAGEKHKKAQAAKRVVVRLESQVINDQAPFGLERQEDKSQRRKDGGEPANLLSRLPANAAIPVQNRLGQTIAGHRLLQEQQQEKQSRSPHQRRRNRTAEAEGRGQAEETVEREQNGRKARRSKSGEDDRGEKPPRTRAKLGSRQMPPGVSEFLAKARPPAQQKPSQESASNPNQKRPLRG